MLKCTLSKALVLLAGLAASGFGAAAVEAVECPLRREYVLPRRIVWQSPQGVEGGEALLAKKRGQVCEGYFGQPAATRLSCKGAALLVDFGGELHGGVQIGIGVNSKKSMGTSRLRLRFGESVAEAMSEVGGGKNATNDHALRDFEQLVPAFGSIEVGNTGFRFLRIDNCEDGEVGIEFVRAVSLMRPFRRLGSFNSSDERLNRIFDTAVRTVQLCCQDYVWDGIKRDRLVWMGDMHPETMAILAVFGDVAAVPETLDYMAEVTPPDRWMNTIATYTLWWIRNLAEWYRFTGDRAYLERHADYLEKTVDLLLGSFRDGEWAVWMFLDWPTENNKPAKRAGTYALMTMAADDVCELSDALGRASLREKGARMRQMAAKDDLDHHGAKSSAALLALSGLRKPRQMLDEVLGRDGARGFSTFYGYYMLEALSEAGATGLALDVVRDYWGGMLDMGATSFWEDFDLAWTNGCFRIDELPVAGKRDIHGDFGQFCYQGFRHSLCHGWSSGPAAWCIHRVLGLKLDGIGGRRVRVEPCLGDLEWAEGSLALPGGERVEIRIERDAAGKPAIVRLNAPADCEIIKAGEL